MLGWIVALALFISLFCLWRTFCLISDERPMAALFRFVPGLLYLFATTNIVATRDIGASWKAVLVGEGVMALAFYLYALIGLWLFLRYNREVRTSKKVLRTT